MIFIETRGNDGISPKSVTFSEAILSPSASFGGLYVPSDLPEISEDFLNSHINSSYKELAFDFLKLCNIDIDDSVLREALSRYDLFDDKENPVPLNQIHVDCSVSELYHGPTRAFKDMALQPFGFILSSIAKSRDEKYIILAATSGDTGPATLETFKNQSNVQVVCLYPDGGTSDVQRLQMTTEEASNLHVLGIRGNFDDTQNTLKELLASSKFIDKLNQNNIKLSAANSVNFGRIIFQIIYHIHSYLTLLKNNKIEMGEKIYLVVPSGNFGNALGAYYAKKMGLPIKKILITSNRNNILTDWICNGEYNLNSRELVQTISPAMDILKSSNVERILFDMFGYERTKELMDSLGKCGYYQLTNEEISKVKDDFDASYSTDEECMDIIAKYAKNNYIMDPHTATCLKAYNKLREEKLYTVLYSTAEWTKFSPTVAQAIGSNAKTDKEALDLIQNNLSQCVPLVISSLFEKTVQHDTIIDKEEIEDWIVNKIM